MSFIQREHNSSKDSHQKTDLRALTSIRWWHAMRIFDIALTPIIILVVWLFVA